MKVEERFTERVENYIKYRPHYPDAVHDYLMQNKILTTGSVIADIGCGTGISSEIFIKNGHTVYGIDPNKKMLDAAVDCFKTCADFTGINASAENTTLQEGLIDVVVCAQAFHWLNKEAAKKEFLRILKPDGCVVLMWNDRRTSSTDFLKVYEDFLQMFATDYKVVDHKNIQDKTIFNSFFGNENYVEKSFYNYQELDLTGLKGRVLSASYMPNTAHQDYDYMMYCLKKIFQRYQENGTVKIEYDTKIYYGHMEL